MRVQTRRLSCRAGVYGGVLGWTRAWPGLAELLSEHHQPLKFLRNTSLVVGFSSHPLRRTNAEGTTMRITKCRRSVNYNKLRRTAPITPNYTQLTRSGPSFTDLVLFIYGFMNEKVPFAFSFSLQENKYIQMAWVLLALRHPRL